MRVGISSRFLSSDSEARSQPRGIILGEDVYLAAICELSDRFARRGAPTWNYCACRPTSPFLEIITYRLRGIRLQGTGNSLQATGGEREAKLVVSADGIAVMSLVDESDGPAELARETAKPARQPAKPSREAAKPAQEVAKPARELANRAREVAEAGRQPAKPAREAAKPARQRAKPSWEVAKAARQPANGARIRAKKARIPSAGFRL
jgi:hypothetical protein